LTEQIDARKRRSPWCRQRPLQSAPRRFRIIRPLQLCQLLDE
jgi:hypothetical protein